MQPAESVESVEEESALPTRVARRIVLVGEKVRGKDLGKKAGGQGEEGTRVGKGGIESDVFSHKSSVGRARNSVEEGEKEEEMGLTLSRKSC